MKVVVDIPNWLYLAIQEHREPIYSQSLGDAVRDGTPLPTGGSGRLIILSEDVIKREQTFLGFSCQSWISDVSLSDATVAIIEADYEKPIISPKYLRQELEQLALEQESENNEMKRKEAAGVIKFEKACVLRQDTPQCNRDCKKCDLLLPTEDVLTAYGMAIKALEQEPKTGHWKAKSFHELFCDNCGFDFDIMRNDFTDKMLYCPNCGAKMIEPQESE